MTNAKLQVALDELERLRDTVKGFKERNGTLPNPDSDAGRALFSLESFTSELHKLNLGKLLNEKGIDEAPPLGVVMNPSDRHPASNDKMRKQVQNRTVGDCNAGHGSDR